MKQLLMERPDKVVKKIIIILNIAYFILDNSSDKDAFSLRNSCWKKITLPSLDELKHLTKPG